MARTETHDQLPPRLTWRSLAGLFEEAWQREQRRRRWWLLAIVLLLAAGVFTAVLTGGGGNGPARPTNVTALHSHAPGSSAPGSGSSVRSRFAVFNQPAASPQAVRRSTRNYPGLAGSLMSKSGVGVDHPATHIIHTPAGTVWVVTGSGFLPGAPARSRPIKGGAACLLEPNPEFGSNEYQSVCGGLIGRNTMTGTSGSFSGKTSTWYGLVPNSVKRVIVSYASGHKITVPVVDNTFRVRLRGPMRQCQTRQTLAEEGKLSTTAETFTVYCRD
jgi:hypothetical protein